MDSREVLAEAGRAHRRIEELTMQLAEGVELERRGQGAKPTHSDPTGALALFRLQTVPRIEGEMAALKAAMDEGERLLLAVSATFGGGEGRMLRLRYWDAMSWGQVGEAFGVSWMTAKRRCDVACDWLDSASPYTICCARGGFAED